MLNIIDGCLVCSEVQLQASLEEVHARARLEISCTKLDPRPGRLLPLHLLHLDFATPTHAHGHSDDDQACDDKLMILRIATHST